MISLKKFNIGKEQLDNRICIAPMCQYSANEEIRLSGIIFIFQN